MMKYEKQQGTKLPTPIIEPQVRLLPNYRLVIDIADSTHKCNWVLKGRRKNKEMMNSITDFHGFLESV